MIACLRPLSILCLAGLLAAWTRRDPMLAELVPGQGLSGGKDTGCYLPVRDRYAARCRRAVKSVSSPSHGLACFAAARSAKSSAGSTTKTLK